MQVGYGVKREMLKYKDRNHIFLHTQVILVCLQIWKIFFTVELNKAHISNLGFKV